MSSSAPQSQSQSRAKALDHVQQVVERSGSSFTLAMRLLPRARRQAMFAVYAFCREVDDIADGDAPEPDKQARLAEWRSEIDRLYDGRPDTPIARALAAPVADYALRREDFLAIIDGMEMDAGSAMRAPSWRSLELYCARVAGAVGKLSVRIFGSTATGADEVADLLGEALQLTNILRDIHEDAGEGRLYLPRELLEKHGIVSRRPAEVIVDKALPNVCRDLAERALQRFREAETAIAGCERRAMRPAVVMMKVYRRILDRLIARGWDRIDMPVKVSKIEKIAIGLRHGLL